MKLVTVYSYIFLIGIFLTSHSSYCGVIKPPELDDSNYNLRQKVIIYNDLSSFKNNNNILSNSGLTNNSTSGILDITNLKNLNNKEYSLSNEKITSPQAAQIKAILAGTEIDEKYDDLSVGTFLDSFKDDPKLRTIYFTSKNLTFNYKSKIRNILDLEFEPEPFRSDELSRVSFGNRAVERELTSHEKVIVQNEAKRVFGLISESFKTIFLIIAGMVVALYLSFRYLLNKYI